MLSLLYCTSLLLVRRFVGGSLTSFSSHSSNTSFRLAARLVLIGSTTLSLPVSLLKRPLGLNHVFCGGLVLGL